MWCAILASLLTVTTAAVSLAEEPPFSPPRSAERIKLPEGFRATLFAGEPDLVKPIAMTIDDRGRLWVVESHSYPNWLPEGKQGRDRILRAARAHVEPGELRRDVREGPRLAPKLTGPDLGVELPAASHAGSPYFRGVSVMVPLSRWCPSRSCRRPRRWCSP